MAKEICSNFREKSDNAESLARTLKETHERVLDYHDLFKVPSAVSASGLALVARGCKSIDSVKGVNYIAAGRGFDLLDGVAARTLNQESDFGALVDASCDKLGMLLIANSALKHDAVPKYALGSMFASNVCSAALTTAASLRHPHENYRPTKTGKYSMAAFNMGIISFLYANALENDYPELNLHDNLQKIGHTATAVGIGLSAPTNLEYAHRL